MKKWHVILAILFSISAVGIIAQGRLYGSKKKAAELQCKEDNPKASKKEVRQCIKEKLSD